MMRQKPTQQEWQTLAQDFLHVLPTRNFRVLLENYKDSPMLPYVFGAYQHWEHLQATTHYDDAACHDDAAVQAERNQTIQSQLQSAVEGGAIPAITDGLRVSSTVNAMKQATDMALSRRLSDAKALNQPGPLGDDEAAVREAVAIRLLHALYSASPVTFGEYRAAVGEMIKAGLVRDEIAQIQNRPAEVNEILFLEAQAGAIEDAAFLEHSASVDQAVVPQREAQLHAGAGSNSQLLDELKTALTGKSPQVVAAVDFVLEHIANQPLAATETVPQRMAQAHQMVIATLNDGTFERVTEAAQARAAQFRDAISWIPTESDRELTM